MKIENIDKYKNVLCILTAKQIESLYEIFGNEKISMVTLKRLSMKIKFLETFNGKEPIKKIASEMKISKMTLYRILKEKKTK